MRCWIVLLLALSLPMQGLAAATLQHCKALNPPAPLMQGHEACAEAAAEAKKADTRCSVCAACCAAAALPSVVPALPLLPATHQAISFTAPPCPVLAADRLERPPRTPPA